MTTYSDACRDRNLFGPWFEAESWATWRVIDKAIFGEKLTEQELSVYAQLSGCDQPPTEPVAEAWLCFGRRSGKDVKAASLVTYLATIGTSLYGIADRLTPGERGVVQLLAVDREQSAVAMGYVRAMLQQPLLAGLVVRDTADAIDLSNRISIEVTTNDKRRVRGRTVIACVMDEVAHWRSSDAASPDEETYQAVAPAMATIPQAMLIGISSPYARRGLFWRKFKEHHGKPACDRVIFLKAPTWTMNPTLPRDGRVIASAYSKDEAWAAAEYGAEFRSDLESFVAREVVESAVDIGVREKPFCSGIKYVAFVDPAGGSGQDSMTLCIAHQEGRDGPLIQDAAREVRPPFSPEDVVSDFVALLKTYRIRKIEGDRWGGEFVREPFKKAGISYETSALPKTDIYREFLPLMNSGRVTLLDDDRLIAQLVSLERRVARGGRDSIDHPPGGHDDVANATAGALYLASRRGVSSYTWSLMNGALFESDKPEHKQRRLEVVDQEQARRAAAFEEAHPEVVAAMDRSLSL